MAVRAAERRAEEAEQRLQELADQLDAERERLADTEAIAQEALDERVALEEDLERTRAALRGRSSELLEPSKPTVAALTVEGRPAALPAASAPPMRAPSPVARSGRPIAAPARTARRRRPAPPSGRGLPGWIILAVLVALVLIGVVIAVLVT